MYGLPTEWLPLSLQPAYYFCSSRARQRGRLRAPHRTSGDSPLSACRGKDELFASLGVHVDHVGARNVLVTECCVAEIHPQVTKQ